MGERERREEEEGGKGKERKGRRGNRVSLLLFYKLITAQRHKPCDANGL